jgi:hypothetical protein
MKRIAGFCVFVCALAFTTTVSADTLVDDGLAGCGDDLSAKWAQPALINNLTGLVIGGDHPSNVPKNVTKADDYLSDGFATCGIMFWGSYPNVNKVYYPGTTRRTSHPPSSTRSSRSISGPRPSTRRWSITRTACRIR